MHNYLHKIKTKLTKKAASQNSKQPKHYWFNLDSPKYELLDKRSVVISGWLLPKRGFELKSLILRNNDREIELPYYIARPDVVAAFPKEDLNRTLRCGFELEYEYEDGDLIIEANFGKGYEQLIKKKIKYNGERPTQLLFNPELGRHMAEHTNLLNNKSQYFYQSAQTKLFKLHKNDPKIIAFYLPQFHPIPENDAVWGKGFTEWHNVASAQPRFVGHWQPILPADFGFYDLRLPQNIKQQIDLAKQHGIYGFCFYYYWFSGKKLLETPLNIFLKHKDWNFNFMICWANENWTKRWDGKDKDIIVAQKYLKTDPLSFIKDIEHILIDPRYIRRDNKPMLAVYRTQDLKNPTHYAKVWREYIKKKHGLDLHLVSVLSFDTADPRTYGFDAAIDFVPQAINFKGKLFKNESAPIVNVKNKLLDNEFEALVFNYRDIVRNQAFISHRYDFPTYKVVMPSWDNDARRKGKGTVFYYTSPDLYAHWLDITIAQQPNDYTFINAWNEWAEGTTLEPTKHYGHALLNRTTEVLAKHSKNSENQKNFPMHGFKRRANCKLAVVIHLYYTDMWDSFRSKLRKLDGLKFDLFVNLQSQNSGFADTIKESYPQAIITTYPNRGRDILPFVHLARQLDEKGYKAVLKLHSKKSEYRKKFGGYKSTGQEWFNDLANTLLPSQSVVKKVAERVIQGGALVGPKGHYISFANHLGSNYKHLKNLLTKIYDEKMAKYVMNHQEKYSHFAGSMFWASMDVLRPVLDLYLMPEDFESETGQIDGTLAHAIERIFDVVAQINKHEVYTCSRLGIKKVRWGSGIKRYRYLK